MLDELLKVSKLVNSLDRTINAIDKTITLGIRVYDRVEKVRNRRAEDARLDAQVEQAQERAKRSLAESRRLGLL